MPSTNSTTSTRAPAAKAQRCTEPSQRPWRRSIIRTRPRSARSRSVFSSWPVPVGRLIEITLGIMTAVGGFVDISELVFAAQAGSMFGYALIWAFVLGTIGMSAFGEMSGRVAAIAKQPVFNLMRHRLGLKLGLVTLAGSLISTLITCAAEVG